MNPLNDRIRIIKLTDVENPYRLTTTKDPKFNFQISHRLQDTDRFNEYNDFSLGLIIKPPEGCFVQLFPSYNLSISGYDMLPQIIHFDPNNPHNEVVIRLRKTKDNEDLSLPFFNGVYGLVFKDYNNDIHIEKATKEIEKKQVPQQKIRILENKNDYLF